MKIHEFIPESRDYRDPDVALKQDLEAQQRRLALAMSRRTATFIGSNATTWDSKSNKRAQDLEDRGISPMAIWRATGNWRGLEGEWRQEISDKDVTLKKTTGSGKLGDFIDHPELAKAYPGIDKNLNVEFVDSIEDIIGQPATGAFFPGTNTIMVSKTLPSTGEERTEEDMLQTLAHEWQHSIQNDYEPEFTPGANPAMPAMHDISTSVNNYHVRKDLAGEPDANPLNRYANKYGPYTTTDAYFSTGGEHMSNATADRLGMDDNERLDNYPGNHMYNQNVTIGGDKVPTNAHGKNIPVHPVADQRDTDTDSVVTKHKDGNSWHNKGNKSTTYLSKDGRYPFEKP